MSHHPIADHALLSDLQSAALVDTTGTVSWWCLPRFSSPSVFGQLLDERAGHFRVGATEVTTVEREYVDDTMALRTTFRTPTGTLELTDVLAMPEVDEGHHLGDGAPLLLLRLARCLEGSIDLEVEFRPRFEYGLTAPFVDAIEAGVVAAGGPTSLRLSSSVELSVETDRARSQSRLREGDAATFAVHGTLAWHDLPDPWAPEAIEERIEQTIEAWRSWARDHQRYEGPYAREVSISGRVLRALTYRQTGALIAAPTTSLPEEIGGERNWDYRFAWVRDASFTLQALWIAACPDEAEQFLAYLTRAASTVHERTHMQIMFGLRGERDLTEHELDWLSGWRDSRPVRVGNAAWQQRQQDIYGELLDAVYRLRDVLGALEEPQQRLLRTLADRAAASWTEPDQGIWEVRGEPRHYLHSKLMCWLALERAVSMSVSIDADDRVEEWSAMRDRIRDAIETRGWDQDRGAFTQAFGSSELDATALLIPIIGFLPADDRRVLDTIDAVAEELIDARGLVRRYRSPDGLPGTEGAFLMCTFWLAEAEARVGRIDRARMYFERASGHANEVGLLSEMADLETGELIGNFPQALSHIGLINAAWAIGEAEKADASTAGQSGQPEA